MTRLRVAACQINPVVGDLDGNVERIIAALRTAEAAGADLAVLPELAVTGYPPEDLLLKPRFVVDNTSALERVAAATGACAALVGFVEAGPALFNAAAVCAGGRVHGIYRKQRLPNYSVFDEERYFAERSEAATLFRIAGVVVGLSICEDGWAANGPIAEAAAGGAELIVNLNASPYHAGKQAEREEVFAERALESAAPLVYLNCVGGQDELVFDGGSFVLSGTGQVLARARQFSEEVLVVDVEAPPRGSSTTAPLRVVEVSRPRSHAGPTLTPVVTPPLEPLDEIYEALVLGTRDYVAKNGFSEVVIGLSGGVDSALVAAIAADAVGPERVHAVLMPSRFSSDHSVTDAEALSVNLGIERRIISIEPAHEAFLEMLAPSFAGRSPDLTEENIQSRIRGTTLMALSNKFGWMVLTTGNKTESAVGYTTLYGDTAGGFAVIKDVPKMTVYELCRRRNERAGRELIPDSIFTKPPSAELRPDQTDQQSLPPYPILDELIEQYVDNDRSAAELTEAGHDAELVARVARLVDVAEYKRRQSPPGVRISRKAFGKDRRLPITNHYRG